MPAILSISSYAGAIIAVETDDGRKVVRLNPNRRGQAEYLVPLVNEVLAEAGVAYKDLSRIGIVVGPGSFTGLRVGLSAARGFGLALDIPVVGIGAFEMYRAALNAEGRVLVALDTQREDCYSIGYHGDDIWLPPMVRDMATLQQLIRQTQPVIVGDAFSMLDGQNEMPLEYIALADALLQLTAAANPAEQPPEPYYLRAPDINLPASAAVAL